MEEQSLPETADPAGSPAGRQSPYSILAFGREHYENVAYFNFETDPLVAATFAESIEPDYLIPILSRLSSQTIIREKTLIVLDEIQLCGEPRHDLIEIFLRKCAGLSYHCGRQPAGSSGEPGLLSFPSKVNSDLNEPGNSCRRKEEQPSRIRGCYRFAHARAAARETSVRYTASYWRWAACRMRSLRLFRNKDLILVRHTQLLLLASYLNDMSKYNSPGEIKNTSSL